MTVKSKNTTNICPYHAPDSYDIIWHNININIYIYVYMITHAHTHIYIYNIHIFFIYIRKSIIHTMSPPPELWPFPQPSRRRRGQESGWPASGFALHSDYQSVPGFDRSSAVDLLAWWCLWCLWCLWIFGGSMSWVWNIRNGGRQFRRMIFVDRVALACCCEVSCSQVWDCQYDLWRYCDWLDRL